MKRLIIALLLLTSYANAAIDANNPGNYSQQMPRLFNNWAELVDANYTGGTWFFDAINLTDANTTLTGSAGVLSVEGIAQRKAPIYDNRDYANLAAAITAIGATVGELHIWDAETLTANATFPSTLGVVIHKGGSITKASTYTCTFNGPLSAGPYQVFSGFDVSDITGLRLSRPEWFGAVAGDTGTNSGPYILAALETVATLNGECLMQAGTYYTTTEITPTVSIDNVRWTGQGLSRIQWNGASDSTKAVVRITTTAALGFSNNVISNIEFDAYTSGASDAGYAFVLEGNNVANGNASMNTFNKCAFNRGSLISLVIGESVNSAATYDSASSQNVFYQCRIGYSPIGVLVNSINAYENTFSECQFNSLNTSSSVVKQHVYIGYGGQTRIENCEFAKLIPATSGHPHGASDDAYCVYTESPITLNGIYTEDARLLQVGGVSHSYNQSITVESVYTNDPDRTGTLESYLSGMYWINSTGSLTVKNASGRSGASGNRSIVLAASYATLENVLVGASGLVTLSIPEQSVIDGFTPGGFDSYLAPYNWNFQEWDNVDGSDDTPRFWSKTSGTGATVALLRSTSNNVYGDYTVDVNCTVATSNLLAGIRRNIDVGPATTPFTLIVSGTYDVAANIPQIRLNNTTKAQQTINTGTGFIVTATIDGTAESTGTQALDIGFGNGLTGQIWIDSIVAVPKTFAGIGTATALIQANAKTNQIFPSIELGHTSDTTLSRSSAGVLAVEGVVVPTFETAIVLLGTATLDVTSTGQTTIYTVPSGKRCILDHIKIVSGATASPTAVVSFGQQGAATDFLGNQTFTNLAAQYDCIICAPVPNATPVKTKSYAAATVIEADVTTADVDGGTDNTVYVFGTLY